MSGLLETALKVSVILLIAILASALLRKRSAALRHWVLTVAIASSLTVPFLLPIVPARYRVSLAGVQNLPGNVASSVDTSGTTSSASRQDIGTQAAFSLRSERSAPSDRVSVSTALQGIWLAGSLGTLLLLLVGIGHLWWLASHARRITGGRWHALSEEVRHSYALRFPARLLQSRHPSLLVTWGWRHARILLPAAADEWSDEQIRIVLAHELAHIARGDWVAQLAAEVLRAVHWFNPLLWIACRRLRAESECACDDAVLARGIDGADYAAHLLTIARRLNAKQQPWLPVPAMARPSSLEGRIRAMLDTTLSRHPLAWQGRIAVIAGLAAITLSIASVQAQSSLYSLTGTVFDSTNRVVPRTLVVLTDPARQATNTIRTDSTGRFELVGLPYASYRLEVTHPGFAPFTDTLVMSESAEREIHLQVGSLEENITVTSHAVPPAPPEPAVVQEREVMRQRVDVMRRAYTDKCPAVSASATIGGNILPPAKTRDLRPIYPEALKAANIGGIVTMDAVIGTDGTVQEIRNVKGPHPDLEAAAVEAVRQWQFTPTLLNCEPVDVSMKVTTTFRTQP